jgi:F420-dependent methylenetetrahydromethanopterin dehydrogenase
VQIFRDFRGMPAPNPAVMRREAPPRAKPQPAVCRKCSKTDGDAPAVTDAPVLHGAKRALETRGLGLNYTARDSKINRTLRMSSIALRDDSKNAG